MKWFVVVCVSERVSDGGMIAMIFHGDMGLMLLDGAIQPLNNRGQVRFCARAFTGHPTSKYSELELISLLCRPQYK